MPITTPAPIGWFEIAGSDVVKTEAFYGEVFGWKFSDSPMPSYRMVDAGEGPGGGITTADGTLPESYAIFSIVVSDVAGTCDRIAELGGRVLLGPAEVPDSGGLVFANVEDPDGNHFGVFSPPAV